MPKREQDYAGIWRAGHSPAEATARTWRELTGLGCETTFEIAGTEAVSRRGLKVVISPIVEMSVSVVVRIDPHDH